MVSCSMPIDELIEQLDCIKDVGPDYPRSHIGIAELYDLGNGWFEMGSRFMIDEENSKQPISNIWGFTVGEASVAPPRYLMKIP